MNRCIGNCGVDFIVEIKFAVNFVYLGVDRLDKDLTVGQMQGMWTLSLLVFIAVIKQC